jgi:hypothetical protein
VRLGQHLTVLCPLIAIPSTTRFHLHQGLQLLHPNHPQSGHKELRVKRQEVEGLETRREKMGVLIAKGAWRPDVLVSRASLATLARRVGEIGLSGSVWTKMNP